MVSTVEIPARQYVRKAALCERFACGPTFIHKLVRQGKLTPIRLSPRMTVYDPAEMEKLVAAARAGEVGAA